MGLEDITGGAKEDHDKEQANEILDELGVESKEDLEQFENRLQTLAEIAIDLDREVERLNKRLDDYERVMRAIIEDKD